MVSTQIGYVRVSSSGQKTDRQLDGILLDTIFVDEISGKNKNRPKLKECLRN
ncbi:MAG: recombinase family protein [Desulfobacteraceae bacterium]|nr:recombinase family protein [Desulfobacteraceae bacterium]